MMDLAQTAARCLRLIPAEQSAILQALAALDGEKTPVDPHAKS